MSLPILTHYFFYLHHIMITLYDLYSSPHCLQFGFYFFCLFHLDILLDRCRSTLHQLLGLLQTQTSQPPNLLNHFNLGLGIKASQLQIKHRLLHNLFHLFSPSIPSSTIIIHIIIIIRKPKMIPYTIHKFLNLQHVQPYNLLRQAMQMRWSRDFIIVITLVEWGEGCNGHFFTRCKFFSEDAGVFGVIVMEWILPWGAFVAGFCSGCCCGLFGGGR
mmetsp:Transcript_32390/g.48598  ORF Transcript_32390/g.48598 Transcript_32390/m.48598 type:complete len:216 (+) Transcript_32390:122-769(+)